MCGLAGSTSVMFIDDLGAPPNTLYLPTTSIPLISHISAAVSGITFGVGAKIAAIPNLVGGVAAATQATTSLQPVLGSVNGVPVIDCTATGAECMNLNLVQATAGYHTLYVVLTVIVTGYTPVYYSCAGVYNELLYSGATLQGYALGAGTPRSFASQAVYETQLALGRLMVLCFYAEPGSFANTGISFNDKIAYNFSDVAAQVPAGTNTWKINTYPGGSTWNSKTKYALALSYNGRHPADERAAVVAAIRNYLNI